MKESEKRCLYTVKCGVMSCCENTIRVVCTPSEIEKVALAIYRGEVGMVSDLGVLVISYGETEKVLIDRM